MSIVEIIINFIRICFAKTKYHIDHLINQSQESIVLILDNTHKDEAI
jgi:hypothetical protein